MNLIQDLLDKEAMLGNAGQLNSPERLSILKDIKNLRGTEAPACWGHDDCSTMILVRCPWRIDCGDCNE